MANQIVIVLTNLAMALAGGIIPVLVWLWFWEHEDKHPEPHKLTLLAFVGGMIAVIAVVPFQELANHLGLSVIMLYIVWAAIEEMAKFTLAGITTLWRAENDEPIDAIMYMIVTALGFSALENTLYIVTPIFHGQSALAITTLDWRFLGASILHVVCSSIVGFGLAFSYYKRPAIKRVSVFFSLCIAIILHSLFNLSIIEYIRNTGVLTLFAVWLSLILILLLFEKVKQINKLKK